MKFTWFGFRWDLSVCNFGAMWEFLETLAVLAHVRFGLCGFFFSCPTLSWLLGWGGCSQVGVLIASVVR
jgi:hypothetical protein